MSHNIKAGVATGREVQDIFKLAKEKGFALPAVNVIGSNSINGVLETARDLNAPVIIQFSNGGGHFNAAGGMQEWTLEKTVKHFEDLLPEYHKDLNAVKG